MTTEYDKTTNSKSVDHEKREYFRWLKNPDGIEYYLFESMYLRRPQKYPQ